MHSSTLRTYSSCRGDDTGAIDHINEMVRQLYQAHNEQSRGADQVLSMIEELRDGVEQGPTA